MDYAFKHEPWLADPASADRRPQRPSAHRLSSDSPAPQRPCRLTKTGTHNLVLSARPGASAPPFTARAGSPPATTPTGDPQPRANFCTARPAPPAPTLAFKPGALAALYNRTALPSIHSPPHPSQRIPVKPRVKGTWIQLLTGLNGQITDRWTVFTSVDGRVAIQHSGHAHGHTSGATHSTPGLEHPLQVVRVSRAA